MSVYPSPKQRNGLLNTVFNRDDYILQNSGGGGASQAANDARYLKNNGVVVSSAQTTFNSSVNIKGVATVDTLIAKQNINTVKSGNWSATQSYSFQNGMVYTLASNDTNLTSLAINDLPTTPLQTYTFTFIIEPSVKNSPFYLNSKSFSINEIPILLGGISNIVLPDLYTYLVQTLTIVNRSVTITPAFIAYTSVSGYQAAETKTLLIAGGIGGNKIALSEDNGITWNLPNNQPFTSFGYSCGFDGKRICMGGNSDICYSDDFGKNWTSTGFNAISKVYRIKYFPESKIWLACGFSASMAYSSDGITWISSNPIFNGGRAYDFVHNGTTHIAVGWGDYPFATSTDGGNWVFNTTYSLQTPANSRYAFCLIYDGSRYIMTNTGFNTSGNIATSTDGITWSETGVYIPMDIRKIAYNGKDTYVAVGSPTNSSVDTYYYYSHDLINWVAPEINLLGRKLIWHVEWTGSNFVIGSDNDSTVNIIYSTDGIIWTASNNSPFTTTVYGFTSIPL
jgi:hypothetical protein